MPNPFQFISEIREMNESLIDKLDEILDQLILLSETIKESRVDPYGDGR